MIIKHKKTTMFFYDLDGISKTISKDFRPWKDANKAIRKINRHSRLSYVGEGESKFVFYDHDTSRVIKIYKLKYKYFQELNIWNTLKQKNLVHLTTPTEFYGHYSATVWADPIAKNYNLDSCCFKKFMKDHKHENLGIFQKRTVILDLGSIKDTSLIDLS